jgi:hypothetical protein
MINSL